MFVKKAFEPTLEIIDEVSIDQALIDQISINQVAFKETAQSHIDNSVDVLVDLMVASDNDTIAFCKWLSQSSAYKQGILKKANVRVELSRVISMLDRILSNTISNILHHEKFQALESGWRGLYYLVEQASENDIERRIKIRTLDLSWEELSKDLHKAIEFDQSEFFRNIYSKEFDMPGGEPFGVIIANYRLSHKPRANLPYNDIDTLKLVSQTAAAAFSPFIVSAHPSFLGLNDFKDLGRPINISEHFIHSDFAKWRQFRETEDARYIGITLPDVLMRSPYKQFSSLSRNKFNFSERIKNPSKDYLWGNAAFTFGSVLIRAFSRYGWFAQIRGAKRGFIDGGMVTSLPFDYFKVSRNIIENSASVNVKIGERVEHELSNNGFIAMCHLKNTRHHVFYSNNSVQQSKEYNSAVASVNSRISGMLQYILSASRFAHYLKVICRNQIGSFDTAQECQLYLQNWIHQYTTASDTASLSVKAKYPLKEARVLVEEIPGKPGSYSCVAHLQPHFQMDQMISSLRLVTELPIK